MRLSILLQYLLPHRLLSRLVYWATRWRFPPWKNFLIQRVVQHYHVNLNEAVESDISKFIHFNAFFTRELKPQARFPDPDPDSILHPADGKISQLGIIQDDRLLQAKGCNYRLVELLGDAERSTPYLNGNFVTIYLSPRDYHRVHMPWAGSLIETVHIPGRLFSVAPWSVNGVPKLFARNERLVCHFESTHGPFSVVMVGALLVSSVETVWGGLEIPPYSNTVVRKNYRDKGIALPRFAELGRFNMGSTVILLFPAGQMLLNPQLAPDNAVNVGQRLGHWTSPAQTSAGAET